MLLYFGVYGALFIILYKHKHTFLFLFSAFSNYLKWQVYTIGVQQWQLANGA